MLVSPEDRLSLISFSGIGDDTDTTPVMPNLALLTLAAMAPEGIEITVVDQQVQPIDYEETWDYVGLTGYANHRDRMREIAGEFRRRGQPVAIVGLLATMLPAEIQQGLVVWSGILKAQKRLSPEFHELALNAMRLFRGKHPALLPVIIIQYKHVVANMQRRGAWQPQLSGMDESDFTAAA